ncbi:hypothetical protein BKA64DRAFT_404683 [Cadophora sp. MPI-SDFR-AT-0126]|nr:hypothetical protein BKA64DRAFT_404683 [Leotiomycetes sp. MPI-SDFR-AT-0126]
MDNSRSIIADSFGKLRDAISIEHAHDFASTGLEDVWKAVRAIDSSQRQRRSAQNLARIKPLLEGIEKYAKVIEVLCNGTPYLPYVWAPIKLVVQLASQHYEVFESILAACADIGAVLPRFDRYEKSFSDIPSFRVALATMYQNVLDFHQEAYKLLSRKAWHVLFLSLWKDYKTRFSGIIDRLKMQRDFLDTEAMSIHMSESKDARAKLQNEMQESQKNSLAILDQLESKARIARLQHAVAWLNVDDKTQEDNYERISNRRHDETCVWIEKNDQLISWSRDDGKNPVLWLSGKPGAGKSVICSYILQFLEQSSVKHHVCYYFCNSAEAGNICGQVLRTIALQLLRQNVDLASLIANQYVYPGTSCSISQLRTLLPQMFETTDSTRIIIDGLDECSKEAQMSVLNDLLRLPGKDVSCKIIVASRREVKITEKLSGKPQIKLDGREEVNSDIRSYVKHQVSSIETDDPDLRQKIETILVEKANGMFLWVRLVSEELRSCGSDWNLEQTANSLPRGLKKAYGRILDRIMDEDHSNHARSIAIRTLEWIACSYRPLKAFEILDGIVFKNGCTELNSRTKMRKSVLDFCRPLIEESPSNTIDFVHFSAKEYVLDEEYKHSTTFISRQTANLNIAFSCVAYLNTCVSLLPHNSTAHSRAALVLTGFHGLQLYANQFFATHLEAYLTSLAVSKGQAPVELISQLQLLLQFSKNKQNSGSKPSSTINLEALHEYPQLVSFLLQVFAFKDSMKQEGAANTSLKSPEDLSIESCVADPTHLSNARHFYQETVETLLDPNAAHNFPDFDSRALQNFTKTYGPAAYICRYLHCSKATDGFDTLKKREAHESAHQRKFRCAEPSCGSFAAGFTSRNALNRHNEKWHRVVTQFAPLLVLLPGHPLATTNSQAGTPQVGMRSSKQYPQPEATSAKHSYGRKAITSDAGASRTEEYLVSNLSCQPSQDNDRSQQPEEHTHDDLIDKWNAEQIQDYRMTQLYPAIMLPLTPQKETEQIEEKHREMASIGLYPYSDYLEFAQPFIVGVRKPIAFYDSYY